MRSIFRNDLFLFLALIAVSMPAFAAAETAKTDGGNSAAPLNVPVRVLQNRYFLKALRPEVSVFGGTVLNESYSNTYAVGARAGIFVTEYLGLEYTYSVYNAQDSADLKAINGLEYCPPTGCVNNEVKSLEPSFIRLKSAHTGLLTFAPIYSKISLFSQFILYSDICFSAGAASLNTSQGAKTAAVIGIGQRFYFAKSFNLRIDATDHIFKETRVNKGENVTSTRHAWVVSLGASAFLWGSSEP